MNLEKGGRKLPQSPAGPDTPPSSLSCDSEHIFHMALLNSFPGLSTVCFLPALGTDMNFVVAPRHFWPVIRHNVSLPVVWGQQSLEDQGQKVGVQAYKSRHFLNLLSAPAPPPPSNHQCTAKCLPAAVGRRLSNGCDSKRSTRAHMCICSSVGP